MQLLKRNDYKVKYVYGDLVITCEHLHDLTHVIKYIPCIDGITQPYSFSIYKNDKPVLCVERKNKIANRYKVTSITKDGIDEVYFHMYPNFMSSIAYCVRMCNTIGSTYALKVTCDTMCLYRCTVAPEFVKIYRRGW